MTFVREYNPYGAPFNADAIAGLASTPIVIPTGISTPAPTVSVDPYDYSRVGTIDQENAKLRAFQVMLDRVGARTRELNALRVSRLRGAVEVHRQNTEAYSWLMPITTASGCPPAGAFEYVWTDVFEGAKENLAALSATPPTRFAGGARVMTWTALINWNAMLLVDATNIRPMFLFPTEYEAGHAAVYVDSRGNPRNGKDHVSEFHFDEAAPSNTVNVTPETQALQTGLFAQADLRPIPVEVLGQTVKLDVAQRDGGPLPGSDGWVRTGAPLGTVHFVNADSGTQQWVPSDSAQIAAISRGLSLNTPQPIRMPGRSGQTLVWNVPAWIKRRGTWAKELSRLSLPRVMLDAIGFFLLNHITWWQGRGIITLDIAEIGRAQLAARSAAWRSGPSGVVIGVVGLLGAIMPIIGVIAGALGELSGTLMDEFVFKQFAVDGPRSLFVRVPADITCIPQSLTESEAEAQRARDRLATRGSFTLSRRVASQLGVRLAPGTEAPTDTTSGRSPSGGGSGGAAKVVIGGGILVAILAALAKGR